MAKKTVPVKYTSRDFETIKQDLIEFAKRYYPDTYQDFNEASFGSLMLDSVAYVGDILSFYLDYQVNESFLNTAAEYNNVLKLARQQGYKVQGAPSSTGTINLYIVIPANTEGLGPDSRYKPIIKQGSTFKSSNGINFLLTEDVDFKHPSVEQVVAAVNTSTGNPITYALRTTGTVISGVLKSETFKIGRYERFKKLALGLPNVSEIMSVTDSEGNEYYEVAYLSQDVIYKNIINRNSDKDLVPSILRPYSVPRRFVLEREGNLTFLQFGYGSDADTALASPVDPSNVVLKQFAKNYISDPTFDPSKLVATDKFGVVPANTTLTIRYRSNSGGDVNVAAGALDQLGGVGYDFGDRTLLINGQLRNVQSSLEVYNPSPVLGDVTLPSPEEVRRRTLDFFATQNRAVTKEDYEAMIYAMPPRFGAVKRCLVRADPSSFKRNLNVYILSESPTGALALAPEALKNNLKIWLNRNKMINDTLDIMDAYIINLGIEFTVLSDPNYNRFDILTQCQSALQLMFSEPLLIGEPFYITDVYHTLNNIPGVVDTPSVKIVNKNDYSYSNYQFNITAATSADGRYIQAPDNVAFEILDPTTDIVGEIK